MTRSSIPYHLIASCGDVLVAACGSRLDTFSLKSGRLTSSWQLPRNEASAAVSKSDNRAEISEASKDDNVEQTDLPPAKRQKVQGEEDTAGSSKAKKKKNMRANMANMNSEIPYFQALISTTNGEHVIGVTGEDKTIRVFQWLEIGTDNQRLDQISERQVLQNSS